MVSVKEGLELIFHIGYAKSGTTTMQKFILPYCNVNYLGSSYSMGKRWNGLSDLFLDQSLSNKIIKRILRRLSFTKPNLLSSESWMTYPYLIGPSSESDFGLYSWDKALTGLQLIKEYVDKISQITGIDVRVSFLVSYRDREKHLSSIWKHQNRYLRLNPAHSSSYEAWMSDLESSGSLEYFNHDIWRDKISSLFGGATQITFVDAIAMLNGSTEELNKFGSAIPVKDLSLIIKNSKPLNKTSDLDKSRIRVYYERLFK